MIATVAITLARWVHLGVGRPAPHNQRMKSFVATTATPLIRDPLCGLKSTHKMIDEITLICSDSPARLRIHSPSPGDEGLNYFVAELHHNDLKATCQVYAFMSNIAELFADMAANWRGWEGEKCSGTLEGELSFRCTSDEKGHAFVKTTLSSGPYDTDWTVETVLRIDANHLEETARKMQRFFRRDLNAA